MIPEFIIAIILAVAMGLSWVISAWMYDRAKTDKDEQNAVGIGCTTTCICVAIIAVLLAGGIPKNRAIARDNAGNYLITINQEEYLVETEPSIAWTPDGYSIGFAYQEGPKNINVYLENVQEYSIKIVKEAEKQ